MIIEITKDNLDELDNSFIDKEYLEREFESNPYAKVLVFKEKGKVVGYIYYSDIYERVEVNQFEVIPTRRNMGYGSDLFKEFIARTNKDITLEVRDGNIPALRIYKKNGFIKKAIREKYYSGIDGILMERKGSSK